MDDDKNIPKITNAMIKQYPCFCDGCYYYDTGNQKDQLGADENDKTEKFYYGYF